MSRRKKEQRVSQPTISVDVAGSSESVVPAVAVNPAGPEGREFDVVVDDGQLGFREKIVTETIQPPTRADVAAVYQLAVPQTVVPQVAVAHAAPSVPASASVAVASPVPVASIAPVAPTVQAAQATPAPTLAPQKATTPQAPASQTQAQKPQVSGPVAVAFDLYDMALVEFKGNKLNASVNVMLLLEQAMIFMVGVVSGGNEPNLKVLLESIGAGISKAPTRPLLDLVEAATGARIMESLAKK
jgi:hypothetical protein